MTKKYYFNGVYIVYGRKLFGKIKGICVGVINSNAYTKGDKVTFSAETFKELSSDKAKILKDFGYTI